jgi:hypothetical protein
MQELEEIIQCKVPRNKKMCKDKWNGLNYDYKKLLDYHKGIGHHNSFLDLFTKERNQQRLLRAFNKECYETIETFQGECIINALIHVQDLQAKGDANYVPQVLKGDNKKTNIIQTLHEPSCKSFFGENFIPNS